MKTFLDLCQDLQRETGYAGGEGLESVVSQTGEYAKLVYWIQESDIYIQNLWTDWRFLYGEVSDKTVEGSNDIAQPLNTMGVMDRTSLGIVVDGCVHFPKYMRWQEYRKKYWFLPEDETDTPTYFTQQPDNTILLSAPMVRGDLDYKYIYYRQPERMAENGDESLIPDPFRRLIVVRAKVMYAEHEDAPEVESGALSEYDDLLEKLQAVHLPGQRGSRMAVLDIPLQEFAE